MNTSAPAIRLGSAHLELTIPRERVYFAFADGRFEYDCHTCGAKCCRGFGYTLNAGKELDAQLALRPAVVVFLRPTRTRDDQSRQVLNCPPACFFLNEDNRCAIQATRGFEAKPETCRLFPFNQLRRVGGYLVVAPHASLCPLNIVAPPEQSALSGHDDLFAAMSAQTIRLDVPEIHLERLSGSAGALFELENSLVRESERSIEHQDFLGFAAAQSAITSAWRADLQESAATSVSRSELETFRTIVCTVLGMSPSAAQLEEPVLVRTLIATAAYIRSQVLFGPWTHAAGQMRIDLERLPHFLVTLHVLLALARDAGMRDVSFQTVSAVCSTHWRLLQLLTYADCAMVLNRTSTVAWPLGGNSEGEALYLTTLRELMPNKQRKRKRALWSILCEQMPAAPVNRHSFLAQVAARVGPNLAMLGGSPPTAVSRRQTYRAALQRWVLSNCDARVMISVAAKLSVGGTTVAKSSGEAH
jgi:hypothetical protein